MVRSTLEYRARNESKNQMCYVMVIKSYVIFFTDYEVCVGGSAQAQSWTAGFSGAPRYTLSISSILLRLHSSLPLSYPVFLVLHFERVSIAGSLRKKL